jgi:hypothetical protein
MKAKNVKVDGVIGQGWVHTHGMAALGLPELEIRGVPNFLFDAAAGLLHHVAEYMIRAKRKGPVKLGQTMAVSDHCAFRFVKAEAQPDCGNHYQVERWRLVDIELTCPCCQEQGETNV